MTRSTGTTNCSRMEVLAERNVLNPVYMRAPPTPAAPGRVDEAQEVMWDRGTEGQRDRGDRGTEGQRDRGTEGQRDRGDRGTEGTEGQRDRGTEGQRGQRDRGDRGAEGQRNRGTEGGFYLFRMPKQTQWTCYSVR